MPRTPATRFYRTYEGLKLPFASVILTPNRCFYRTYEGLKLDCAECRSVNFFWFLSYL
ncbi:hypothetical protein B4113_3674 [Geobacillus sp. B4113_201601]|nr:hypothetical protein B4113_3674 [Geobacillus sp. B4113_201601]